MQYSCEVNLPYMDSAEPNLDPEIEETNDSDNKDTRMNPADYVVRTHISFDGYGLSILLPRGHFVPILSELKVRSGLVSSTLKIVFSKTP